MKTFRFKIMGNRHVPSGWFGRDYIYDLEGKVDLTKLDNEKRNRIIQKYCGPHGESLDHKGLSKKFFYKNIKKDMEFIGCLLTHKDLKQTIVKKMILDFSNLKNN